ncbi:hypothetical protein N7540_008696 [Penicillium herquei]|nr:hypothetical protein N7540_008696 [Penicillium herquei]
MASAEMKTAAIAEAIHTWQNLVSAKGSDNSIEADLVNKILDFLKDRKIDPYLEKIPQSLLTDYQPELDKLGTDLWNANREASAQCGSNTTRQKSLSAASRLEALRLKSSSVDSVLLQPLNAEYYMMRVKLAFMQCRPDLAEYHFSHVPPAKSISNARIVIETCYEIACDPLLVYEDGQKVKWLERAVDFFDMCSENKTKAEQIPAHIGLTLRHTLVQTYLAMNTENARTKLLEHLKVLEIVIAQGFHILEFLWADFLNQIYTTMELTDSSMGLGALMVSAFNELLRLSEQEVDLIERCFLCFVATVIDSDMPTEDKISEIYEATYQLDKTGVKPLPQATAHAVYALVWKEIDTQFKSGHFREAQGLCEFLNHASSMLLLESSEFNQVQAIKKFVSCALERKDLVPAKIGLRELHQRLDLDSDEFDPQAMWLEYLVKLHSCNVDSETQCACQEHLSIQPTNTSNDMDKVEYLQACVMAAQETGKFSEVMKAVHKMCSFVHRLSIEYGDPSPSLPAAEKRTSLLTIYVLSVEIEEKENLEQGIPETMAHQLGVVANRSRPSTDPEQQYYTYYTASELRWICQKAFNLSWALIKNSKFDLVSRLTNTYSALSRAYGTAPIWMGTVSAGTLTQIEIDQCRLFLLELAKHASLARLDSPDESNDPIWHYSRVLTLVNNMENSTGIQRILALHPDASNPEMNVWVMYMEASFFLRNWPEAARGLFKSCYLQSEGTCRQVVGLILRMYLPRKMKVYMIRRLLCGFWQGRGFPRWMTDFIPYLLHILYDLCTDRSSAFHRVPSLEEDFNLESRPHNLEGRANAEEGTLTYLEIAELVLDQAILLTDDAKYLRSSEHQAVHHAALETQGHSVCHNLAYPPRELAYLARSSFNQAMDFYSEEKDEDYRRWAEKAIQLAERMEDEDGANLVQLFKRRLDGLL